MKISHNKPHHTPPKPNIPVPNITAKPIAEAQKALTRIPSPTSRPYEIPPSKTSRKRLNTMETDFFVNPGHEQISPEANLELIRGHASARLQIFASTALLLYKAGLRSDNTVREVKVGIGSADLQIGKGSRSHPACHMNAAAGYVDDFRKHFIEEISSSGSISPEKKKWLSAKGFSSADFELLQSQNFSQESIDFIFKLKWPEKHQRSLFSEISINRKYQGTTILERDVNLVCDKTIESTIRPKLIEIYFHLIHGKITPKEATRLVTEECKTCLGQLIRHLSNLEKALQVYLKCLEDLKSDPTNISLREESYKQYKTLKTEGLKTKKIDLAFVENLELSLNDSPNEVTANPLDSLIPKAIEKCQANLEQIGRRKRYAQAELEGTGDGDFHLICGLPYDSNGNEYTEESYRVLRDRLLLLKNEEMQEPSAESTQEEYQALLTQFTSRRILSRKKRMHFEE